MRISRARTLAAVVTVAVGLTACGATASQRDDSTARADHDRPLVRPSRAHPLAGRSLYVTPGSPAAAQVGELEAQGDTRDARLLQRIAREPVGNWFANDAPRLRAQVHELVSAAAARGKLALIVAYDIPKRDCSASYSTGGNPSPTGYRAWIGRLAAGIGGHSAVVILEPDAIPDLVAGCLGAADAQTRLELLRGAVAVLKRNPRVLVYLDAGNPGWINPSSKLVAPLRAAGIGQADGFALNVANFQTTASNIAYGAHLSRLLHGAHFVIDTGRNGNGPEGTQGAAPNWCNPPGRALGHVPATSTGHRGLDAYLWVKQPGASDGNCRPGAPPAGQWWPQYALELVGARP